MEYSEVEEKVVSFFKNNKKNILNLSIFLLLMPLLISVAQPNLTQAELFSYLPAAAYHQKELFAYFGLLIVTLLITCLRDGYFITILNGFWNDSEEKFPAWKGNIKTFFKRGFLLELLILIILLPLSIIFIVLNIAMINNQIPFFISIIMTILGLQIFLINYTAVIFSRSFNIKDTFLLGFPWLKSLQVKTFLLALLPIIFIMFPINYLKPFLRNSLKLQHLPANDFYMFLFNVIFYIVPIIMLIISINILKKASSKK